MYKIFCACVNPFINCDIVTLTLLNVFLYQHYFSYFKSEFKCSHEMEVEMGMCIEATNAMNAISPM